MNRTKITLTALVLLLAMLASANADCISQATLNTINQLKNYTNNTIDFTPLIIDLNSTCVKTNAINDTVNYTNIRILNENVQWLNSWIDNITTDSTNMTIINYYIENGTSLVNNITNIKGDVQSLKDSINTQTQQISGLNGNINTVIATVNAFPNTYSTKTQVSSDLASLNSSFDTRVSKLESPTVSSNIWLWAAIALVGALSVGLFFMRE